MRRENMPTFDLDHFILEVTDPATVAAFLMSVLGLTPVRLEEFQTGRVPFPSVRVGPGTLIDLFPPRLWRGATAHNPHHVCFAMSHPELDVIRSRLVAQQIPVTKLDDHNFGARGYGYSLYFDGPDALNIEIRSYDAPA